MNAAAYVVRYCSKIAGVRRWFWIRDEHQPNAKHCARRFDSIDAARASVDVNDPAALAYVVAVEVHDADGPAIVSASTYAAPLRFERPASGVLRVTVDGVTYTATHYPSGGTGTRQYWTIQTSDRDYTDGNDWYEPSEQRVREAIAAVAAKRRRAVRS